ncbi:protein CHUP1, chloroplastic-like [Bidens hawaiensis]|uniref:protein CHUP1, chloroplastic-like n=1 Tax=Bidens hawaiensis TaxID=980011 RepID=UPI00404A47EA
MVKTDSQEQEIKNLENMVKLLKERERNLEAQLLEYYGLKEQQTAVTELQNRLKLNTMEAKVFALKIESLEADNKRLASQVVDYNKALMDLEAARTKINVLKQKLRSEAAQNKERILDLQQWVEKMQEDELKLCKLKDLEDEVCELRKSNHDLQVEKSELTQ